MPLGETTTLLLQAGAPRVSWGTRFVYTITVASAQSSRVITHYLPVPFLGRGLLQPASVDSSFDSDLINAINAAFAVYGGVVPPAILEYPNLWSALGYGVVTRDSIFYISADSSRPTRVVLPVYYSFSLSSCSTSSSLASASAAVTLSATPSATATVTGTTSATSSVTPAAAAAAVPWMAIQAIGITVVLLLCALGVCVALALFGFTRRSLLKVAPAADGATAPVPVGGVDPVLAIAQLLAAAALPRPAPAAGAGSSPARSPRAQAFDDSPQAPLSHAVFPAYPLPPADASPPPRTVPVLASVGSRLGALKGDTALSPGGGTKQSAAGRFALSSFGADTPGAPLRSPPDSPVALVPERAISVDDILKGLMTP